MKFDLEEILQMTIVQQIDLALAIEEKGQNPDWFWFMVGVISGHRHLQARELWSCGYELPNGDREKAVRLLRELKTRITVIP